MRLLSTVILITLLSDSYGQVSGYEFKREDLKGYEKLTSTSINYYETDSILYRSIYFIDDIGDITRSEHYDENELTSWVKYEYHDNGLLKYEENHRMIFRYDEKTQKEIGIIRDDFYHGKVFEYNGKLLTKVTYVDYYRGSESYDYEIIYEYDSSGRPIKEISIDRNIGLVGRFKPNSSIIDTLYNKEATTRWATEYVYKGDSIISTDYNEEGEIWGYSFTKLNAAKKPIFTLDTDPQKEGVKSVTRTYDSRGNLTREIIEIIDIDKITNDMAAGDEHQLFYNERALPVLVLTKENGKVISKQIVKYE